MKPTFENLLDRHRFIFGSDADETAVTLYRRFPDQRGYSTDFTGEERNTAKLNAVITLAFSYVYENPHVRVIFFVPKSSEAWVLERLRGIALNLFANLKLKKEATPPEKLQSAVALYKRIFGQMMIGPTLTSKAPAHWVAYGFQDHDASLPVWLREGLV